MCSITFSIVIQGFQYGKSGFLNKKIAVVNAEEIAITSGDDPLKWCCGWHMPSKYHRTVAA